MCYESLKAVLDRKETLDDESTKSAEAGTDCEIAPKRGSSFACGEDFRRGLPFIGYRRRRCGLSLQATYLSSVNGVTTEWARDFNNRSFPKSEVWITCKRLATFILVCWAVNENEPGCCLTDTHRNVALGAIVLLLYVEGIQFHNTRSG